MMCAFGRCVGGFVLAMAACGCYSPSGGLLSHTGGPQTYVANEMMQKTITMTDTRTNEVFFSIDIPPGKQLTIDFSAGEGDDPVYTPDLLHWELMDKGTRVGRLHNAMTVPNASSRRIDVALHRNVEYVKDDPQYRLLRTDEVRDRPDWWTPQGGPIPKDERQRMYDN